jgi:hypothetical protein
MVSIHTSRNPQTEPLTPIKKDAAIKIVENHSAERHLSERTIVLASDRVTPMMKAFMSQNETR